MPVPMTTFTRLDDMAVTEITEAEARIIEERWMPPGQASS